MDDVHEQEDLDMNINIDSKHNGLLSEDASQTSADIPINFCGDSQPVHKSVDIQTSPYTVISNNAPDFRYKYPEAKPTPPNEDDVVWNRTYTAADSRLYHKHSNNAAISKKFRLSGETRTLALNILAENKRKYFAAVTPSSPTNLAITDQTLCTNTTVQTSEIISTTPSQTTKTAPSTTGLPDISFTGITQMSISEKVKAEGGRKRKSYSTNNTSNKATLPSTWIPSTSNPASLKLDKELSKKPTTNISKKPGPKPGSKSGSRNLKQKGPSTPCDTGHPSKTAGPSDSESNDGGEYCICRGPDDHRMMVNCEGPCKDWYHCSCLGIDIDDARELLDRYVCPKCSSDDFSSTYKPMCRNHSISGCRKAALVGIKPNPSMYCSEQHRKEFWNYVATKLRSGNPSGIISILSHEEVSSIAKLCTDRMEWQSLGSEPKLKVKKDVDPNRPVGLDYITSDESHRIQMIHEEKSLIKRKIEHVQAQKVLLVMIHEHCKKIATHPKLENKDFCGYDNRLAMNEAEFLLYKGSEEGKKAFKTGFIGPRTQETITIAKPLAVPNEAPIMEPTPTESSIDIASIAFDQLTQNICLKPRRRCKHFDWRDIHSGDYQLMITNYEEHMAKLQAEEDEIIQEAELREATKDYDAHNITIQHF